VEGFMDRSMSSGGFMDKLMSSGGIYG